MLVGFSLILYLAGLLVIIRVLRGLHHRDELMDRIYSSWSMYHRGEAGSSNAGRQPEKEQAVQVP